MNFFDDFGKKVSSAADKFGKKVSNAAEVVGKKAEESIEIQKLRNQINALERKQEKDYIELGKIVYKRFQVGDELDDASLAYCEEINRNDIVIEQCKKDITEIKGVEACKVCGAMIAKGSLYCNHCGAKVEE